MGMDTDLLSDTLPRRPGPRTHWVKVNPIKKNSFLKIDALSRFFQYLSPDKPITPEDICGKPDVNRAHSHRDPLKTLPPSTLSTFCPELSEKTEGNNYVLDYDHPEKLFPYAGILDLSRVKIPSAVFTNSLIQEAVPKVEFCPQCGNTLSSKAFLRNEKAGIIPCFEYYSFQSTRVRSRYFGHNRIKRNDIGNSRVLSSGFYFGTSDINFTSEPICILFVLTFFALSFCGAVSLSFHPLIVLIKPPGINFNRYSSFSKPQDKSSCQATSKYFLKLSIRSPFISFKPQLTSINLAKASGCSEYEVVSNEASSFEKANLVREKESNQLEGHFSKVYQNLSLALPTEFLSSNQKPAKCMSCLENIKTFDLNSHNKICLNYILSLGHSFKEENLQHLENDLQTSSHTTSHANFQEDCGSLFFGTQHSVFENSFNSDQMKTSHRPSVIQDIQHKQNQPLFTKIPPFNLVKLFPLKQSIPKLSNKESSLILVKDTSNSTPKLFELTQDIKVYYKKTSVLEKLRFVLRDSVYNNNGEFGIKKSFFDRKEFSYQRVPENYSPKERHTSLKRKQKGSLELCRFDKAFKLSKRSFQERTRHESSSDVDYHCLERSKFSQPRKYEKRLNKLLESGRQRSEKDECSAFMPQKRSDCKSSTQESSFRITVTSTNVRDGKFDFKPAQGIFIKSPGGGCETFSKNKSSSRNNSFTHSSFVSFNGFSFKSRQPQDFDQRQQDKKFATLISRFPLSSSELFSASSVLEFPTIESLMPLNCSSLLDPVDALNIGSYSETSLRQNDITDMNPKSNALRINYLTQECEDWSFFEGLTSGSLKKIVISNSSVEPISKLQESPLISSGKSFQGLSNLADDLYYDVMPFNSKPDDYETSSNNATKSASASANTDGETPQSVLRGLSSSLLKSVNDDSHFNGKESNYNCIPHDHSAATIPSPFISADKINTAGEFLSDSDDLKGDCGVDEYPKSILLTSKTHTTKSKYPNKVHFSLKLKVVEEFSVFSDDLSSKMLAFDQKLTSKMQSFAEKESKRQRDVRQKISQALVDGSIHIPSKKSQFGLTSMFSTLRDQQNSTYNNSSIIFDQGERVEARLPQARVQILTLGQNGELRPHFFQYIDGALKSVSNETSGSSWEYA